MAIRKLAHNICRTKFSRQLKYLYLHLYNSKTNLEVLNIYNLLKLQITLRKENGSFGLVIRGGHDEEPCRKRPFTIIHVSPQGSTFNEGSIRPGDRILALNGKALHDTTLPQLQSLLYAQDGDTVMI